MKAIAIAFSLLLVAGDASAISRRDVSNMSCEQAQALVRSEGAVILRFRSPRNPSAMLYDRYVSDDRYCGGSEQTTRASASTADNVYCPLRKCVEIELFDLN
jgi:hypothetical protein